jgi:hypothetical protein
MIMFGRVAFVQETDRKFLIWGNIILEFYFWREGYHHWISVAKRLDSLSGLADVRC